MTPDETAARNKYQWVKMWVENGEEIKAQLDIDGGDTVNRIMAQGLSLREISRRTFLSPTYLSRVKNGDSRISPTAYLSLLKLEMSNGTSTPPV